MKNKPYLILIIVGFLLWIVETAAFGFNDKPESGLERALDFIAITMMLWGIIGDILSNVTIVKNDNTQKTYNINTKTVEVTGDNQKIDYNFGTTKKETVSLIKKLEGKKDERQKTN